MSETRKLGEKNLHVALGSGDTLDVRQFSIHERLSSLFQVNLVAVSKNTSIELDDVVGQPAQFSMAAGKYDRTWSGVCNHLCVASGGSEPDGRDWRESVGAGGGKL